jgi:RNA polymerase sigma-19 factor, ECF subfamily
MHQAGADHRGWRWPDKKGSILSTGYFFPTSVEALYCDHHSWLKSWLHRRLGNADQAADLAHDTFIRLLSSDRVPAALDEPRAFLTTVAQRLVSNHWRREKLEKAYLEALARAPVEMACSPETRAILLETLLELDRLLDGLPAVVRRAFLLSQLDGHTHAQVADALGVSIPTVKRYIVKALQRCCFADLSFTG